VVEGAIAARRVLVSCARGFLSLGIA